MSRESATRRKILKASGSLSAAGIVSTAGCLGSITGGGGGGKKTIGMANSLTGSLDAFGARNERGKKLAVEDVNSVGLRGGELEIVTEDTKSRPGPAVRAAKKLVNQNEVPMLIGAVNSSSSLSIFKSVIQGTNVAQLSQNSTSPDLTNFPKLMRVSPPGKAQASAIAGLVGEDGHDSVAVSFINNAYGKGIAQSFRSSFDGEVKYFQSHEQGKSSYSSVVTSMHDADADAWLFVTYQPEFATIAQNAFDRGYTDAALYGADSVKGPKVLKQAPEDFLQGMKVVAPAAALNQQNYKNFAGEFEKQFDTSPTSWAAYAYDAVITAAIAIQADDEFMNDGYGKRVKTVKDVTRPPGKKVMTYEEAHEALKGGGGPGDVNYQGVSGPIDLDENGDPVAFLQVFTVKGGEYESTGFISGE